MRNKNYVYYTYQLEYNEYFFDIDSKKIGRTHYVDNRKWKVVLNQSSLSDFYNQPIYSQGFLKTNLEYDFNFSKLYTYV